MNGKTVRKNISIKKRHEKWIKDNHLKFSSWIQDKIDEEIEEEETD
ncbi:MAG: hypothetical protein ACOC44_19785 [Promethearchaeia archaeon]